MKKILTFALTLALAVGLWAPALAAEGTAADQRATAVTLAVKEKLDLDTTGYDKFNSNFSEDVLEPMWRLSWSGENSSMSISVTEAGRVESYYCYSYRASSPVVNYWGRFTPTFPALTRTQARDTAQAFLDKVLEEGESVELEPAGKSTLGASSYSFYGNILVNGLPSPFSFSVRVGEDNTVTSFYRTGTGWSKILGGTPSPVPAATGEAAGAALRSTFDFRLEYVLADDRETAVLRYLPLATDEYYVDAATGALVDLTEIYAGLNGSSRWESSMGMDSAMMESSNALKGELTAAEQEGVAKLEGVLSKEELDAAVREMAALGLDRYSLGTVSYSVDSETGDVTARAQYVRRSDEGTWRRYVTVDGKTAELFSVSSSTPWMEELPEDLISAAEARVSAEAFLAGQCGEDFAKADLYNAASALAKDAGLTRSFTYAQKENGYFFPANSISVGVDCTDGSISSYYNSFDYDVTFASPEGIVDLEAAKDAWLGTYDVTLQYLAVPKVLDLTAEEYQALIDQGYSYLYTLELAYQLEREGGAYGVDAHTGQALVSTPAEVKTVTYDDLEGHWVEKMAQTLAEYDVGWLGGSMDPDRALTQADLVALLVSTGGTLFDPESDDVDKLYSRAYSMGILAEEQRDDGAVVDRCQMVKLLLDGAGYGDVANLPGIFRCGFSDAEEVPEEYMGYVALAQGLRLVEGDGGAFSPNAPATRAQAATLLYRYLAR